MNIKWMLGISAVALCLIIIVSMPGKESALPLQGEPQDLNNAQVRQATIEQRIAINQNASFSSIPLSISDADSEKHVAVVGEGVEELQSEQQVQPTSDAFPDVSLLSADQVAEPRQTDESELEAERNNIDLYFPVDQQITYEPSEVEIEQQRLEMEQQIAEQANALERPSYVNEKEFEMPPSEY